jgi:hypothetical protein
LLRDGGVIDSSSRGNDAQVFNTAATEEQANVKDFTIRARLANATLIEKLVFDTIQSTLGNLQSILGNIQSTLGNILGTLRYRENRPPTTGGDTAPSWH